MKKIIGIRLVLFAIAVSILLPVNSSVKQSFSNRPAPVSVAVLSGNPLPIPTPPGFATLSASGNPLPIPTPPGAVILSASGNPLPIPTPPRSADLSASGNPLPIPTPPGQFA